MNHSGGADLFRLMFERSADAILLLDTSTNTFTAYNQATLTMLGCTREELSTLHPSALSPERQPDGRPSFEKANDMIATAVARGSHRFEWVHRSPHREDFWVEVLLTPIESGASPLVLVVWRDITERRSAERALLEAQKGESLGMLAAGIAHDLNNVLSAVTTHLELARTVTGTSSPATLHLDAIGHAIRRAAGLSRQMLAYGGRAHVRVEAIDLSRAIHGLADLLGVAMPKGVSLRRRLTPDLPAVRGDVVQVQQVILNLVTNAGEAIGSAGGVVELTTELREVSSDEVAQDFRGQALSPGRCVVLAVSDTGVGMTPEVKARLFDPFFSTKGPGRGLGLSATVGILRAHGAGYRIEPMAPQGTRFEVLFPAMDAPPLPSPRPVPTPKPGVLAGTVLLVDDEDMVRAAGRELLLFLGAEVVEAADGEQAIAMFRAAPARFTWVLMDLTMPRCDGHAAFLAMRATDPAVKVVLVSGWASDDLARRFAQAPPAAFLEKPYKAGDLVRVAAEIGVTRTPLGSA